jgi:hypothetical protein
VNVSADLAVSASGVSTGTPRDDLLIGLQRHGGRCGDLVDQAGTEHRADLAAEELPGRNQAFARRIRTEVRHERGQRIALSVTWGKRGIPLSQQQ